MPATRLGSWDVPCRHPKGVAPDVETLEAIRTRRTIHQFAAQCPPRPLVEQVLEAATWAPNFWETELWRFFVFAGAAREELSQLFVRARLESLTRKGVDPDSPPARARVESERKIALLAPVVVAVVCVPADHLPNVEPVEELEAVAAAAQNMLLAAHALGLGTQVANGRRERQAARPCPLRSARAGRAPRVCSARLSGPRPGTAAPGTAGGEGDVARPARAVAAHRGDTGRRPRPVLLPHQPSGIDSRRGCIPRCAPRSPHSWPPCSGACSRAWVVAASSRWRPPPLELASVLGGRGVAHLSTRTWPG